MPITWILLAGVLVSYFISPYLPLSWGWENNFLEWLQVAILAIGMTLNYRWWQNVNATIDSASALFLASTLPLWLLMIGRELSWGRVFFPSGFDAVSGPTFVSLAELPYGTFVNPLLTVIIVSWLFVVIKYRLYRIPYELLKTKNFPIYELLIVILALLVAGYGEKKLHLPVMEEFDECVAYLGLILTAYRIKNALKRF
ncbi:hypothetical protein [Anaerospora hongkongensis]|uniref:hypothetical protein n=1 Tax=Anaerospora hongkongensis TaxID=244830 RepID=UPI00289C4365|nr:hypothetical protein [Anaerospora hongkongensis]